MVPFAGWLMPVQYSGILREHQAVRTAAGLFDLGHMGQIEVRGPDARQYLQWVTSNDVARLDPGQAQYALLTNPDGGVIDDVIIYRGSDREPSPADYMVVVNASNRQKDMAWIEEQLAERSDLDAQVTDISDRLGMIAIQGPRAEGIVSSLTGEGLGDLESFRWREAVVAGIETQIARTGYTGEDGFEFYVPDEHTGALWDALLEAGRPQGLVPIGLGARDTLRLEARMPLYGQELGDDIGPLEAGLGWAVALEKGDFVGREPIVRMREAGPRRRTVGFRLAERSGAPRHGFPVYAEGRRVGHVTSGAFSPTLGANIGLALVEREAAGIGKPLTVEVRGRQVQAEQVKLPFYRRPAAASRGG